MITDPVSLQENGRVVFPFTRYGVTIVLDIVLSSFFIDQSGSKSISVLNLYSIQNFLLENDVDVPNKTNYRSHKVCALMRI
jgi:hypothetical protein